MKTKSIVITSFLLVCLVTLTSMKTFQDTKTIEAVFDSNEDYAYNFIGISEAKEEYMITFHKVEESVLKAYDLKSDKFLGAKFSITYTTKTETIKDEDGYDKEVETYAITALRKL